MVNLSCFYQMNKLIALFLISVFMCANTSVGQLLKIPNLFEHYQEHKNSTVASSLSFVDFIKLHYSENSDHNHDSHQDLPFKTIESTSNLIFLISFETIKIQITNFYLGSKRHFFYKDLVESSPLTSIWLPPKIA